MHTQSSTQKPLLFGFAALAVIGLWLIIPAGRRLAGQFLDSLRMDKPQTVNVNLNQFVGPSANRSLQQMVTQMISSNVTTTLNEPEQQVATVADASTAAGFHVEAFKARSEAPAITVDGAHAYKMTVDRARLQAILDEAGRKDLVVPASVNGAAVSVKIPRAVVMHYGTCPGPSSAAANITAPTPTTTHFDNCLILREGPSPQIDAPQNIQIPRLAEIGMEVAGMTPDQAHEFLSHVSWQALLGVSFPRFLRTYRTVNVQGVSGTLLTLGARQGPDYALIWAKDGIVYSLRGFGNSDQAVQLAQSLQ